MTSLRDGYLQNTCQNDVTVTTTTWTTAMWQQKRQQRQRQLQGRQQQQQQQQWQRQQQFVTLKWDKTAKQVCFVFATIIFQYF